MSILKKDNYYVLTCIFWFRIIRSAHQTNPFRLQNTPKALCSNNLMQKWRLWQIFIILPISFLKWVKYPLIFLCIWNMWRESEGMLIGLTHFRSLGAPTLRPFTEKILMQKWQSLETLIILPMSILDWDIFGPNLIILGSTWPFRPKLCPYFAILVPNMAIPGPNKATLDPNTVILGVNSATLGPDLAFAKADKSSHFGPYWIWYFKGR